MVAGALRPAPSAGPLCRRHGVLLAGGKSIQCNAKYNKYINATKTQCKYTILNILTIHKTQCNKTQCNKILKIHKTTMQQKYIRVYVYVYTCVYMCVYMYICIYVFMESCWQVAKVYNPHYKLISYMWLFSSIYVNILLNKDILLLLLSVFILTNTQNTMQIQQIHKNNNTYIKKHIQIQQMRNNKYTKWRREELCTYGVVGIERIRESKGGAALLH